ncbi:acetyl-CoA carboxylase biotin carboxylase subunit [Bacillus sp. DTU_2020_1000418_1_SI_GHA_SEK_038]|uniref:acetyl-CoA carboxylase biotin carboxylase subunit n=1 Tax=Bacillus sp. DTU_2020_1000418_1_SI_GHA_SEK_038 TaxID=3077585 RepID=UPI0028ED25A7|nr:acetyl-CoA carboxylase biotin carboxylase subunit [Bacillus sp. DTU_2020_1000418_1_SI_GHA_SEK_038]WNS73614.1 acetyl-CoA carboxylase biotin carboxylase subunit [Bacillus sp. DTU_2020_1000418_1_SI_GHA_SEK_038]
MFSKILIANRGEIALRVIRTCQKLGIKTVAIYSEADADSLFVRNADEAYCVGKPQVNQSYLNVDEIIRVAKESGAEAVHPGYGLLSENAAFAARCKNEGLVFIGPAPEIIASMGSKIEARKMMKEAGVPIIEGINTALADEEEAKLAAEKIGYPLMLKASAGGGGIGMQLVHSEEELVKAFAGNKKRAESFFGNGAMFLEKYIPEPHHIEVQILADTYGNVVPLWERECSIQRRNQKVVEEAPSPFISEDTRLKMLDSAVLAAKHIGYSNAGTIEFLVDKEQNYYFLEMNTRLQVEHPVTEEITGLDLVEEQLKVATGQLLSFTREEVIRKGHAIEVRIYAEDPNTFFPSPGKITEFQLPHGEGIRNECAIEAGSQVTPFYDPMIAKLIAWGETRDEAAARMKTALENYKIVGIKTNIPMLLKTVTHEQFLSGYTTTQFVNEYYLPFITSTK